VRRHRNLDPLEGGERPRDRRPVRGVPRAARRVLPGRGQGPGRNRRYREAHPDNDCRRNSGGPSRLPPAPRRLSATQPDRLEGVGWPPGDMTVEEVHRDHYGRILATVIRLVGDFDRSEEAVQQAFAAAVESWRAQSVPHNPVAWLVSTARFKAID